MNRKRKTMLLLISCGTFMLLTLHACKKDTPEPHNPYDDIVRDDTTTSGIPVDSLTITYLHKKVLSTRCALPGCHVGNFEPDFRTPQSSFSTLVYAPVLKNNAQNEYAFRVIPYNTAKSVLYQRVTNCCFVNTNDRMPQDDIGVPLPDSSLNLITDWINYGARDMFGLVARLPNNEPLIQGYIGLSTDYQTQYSTNRLDSIYYNPFIVPIGVSQFYIAVVVSDDSTAISQLQYNKLKISQNADDFSSAITLPATYLSAGNNQVWVATVNASSLPANDTLYMRYYVNDGQHPQNTEFPRDEQIYAYKTYWSFIRQ